MSPKLRSKNYVIPLNDFCGTHFSFFLQFSDSTINLLLKSLSFAVLISASSFNSSKLNFMGFEKYFHGQNQNNGWGENRGEPDLKFWEFQCRSSFGRIERRFQGRRVWLERNQSRIWAGEAVSVLFNPKWEMWSPSCGCKRKGKKVRRKRKCFVFLKL